MNENLLLSVVVPVYNAAPYLRQCIESIIHQSYRNLEIILVTDGVSADGSNEICDEYAKKDSRVKVLHRPHEGVTATRKAAVMAAAGDYIACVDSDDWLDLDAYEKLIAAMGNSSPDVLLHGYQSEYAEKKVICHYSIPVGYFDLAGMNQEIYPRLLRVTPTYQWEYLHDSHEGELHQNLQSEILESVWSKIVKRQLLQESHTMLPDGISIGEDIVCGVHTLFLANSVMVTHMAPYHYRILPVSASHGSISIDRYKGMFSALYDALADRPLSETYLTRLYGIMLRNLLTSGYELFLETEFSDVLFGKLEGRRVALYGAGKCGQEIYRKTGEAVPDQIVLWVDMQFEKYREEGLPVESVDQLLHQEFDAVIVALIDENICQKVKQNLVNMGIPSEKIRYASASPDVCQAVKRIMLKG